MIKGCLKKIKNKFYCGIMPFVVGIATSGLIFQMMYFLPAIQTNSIRMMLETSCVGFYIMCFISYYRAIVIKNTIPETLIMPRRKVQLKNNHLFYTQKKQCEKENQRFKPSRTSHCHLCKCVSRMDHHCPYTNSCVGARNLKAFILFCGYGGIFALQFFIMSFVYFFKLKNDQVPSMSQGQIFIWMFLTFFSFLLAFSMNGLAFSNLLLVSKNITQLEMLKGHFRWSDKHGTHPNPYDLGALSNFNSVFDGNYWLFWWPTQTIFQHDGTQWPMRPPVTEDDKKQLPQEVKERLKDPLTKWVPKTIEQLRVQEQKNYEGVVFFYLGEQYTLKSQKQKQVMKEVEGEQMIKVEEEQKPSKTQQELEILEGIYDE